MNWQENDDPRLIDQVPPWLRAIGRLSLRFALIGLAFLVMTLVYYWLAASRYDIEKVTQMPERTVLLDRTGKELGAIHGNRRRLITRQEIPEHLLQALLTREDKGFLTHKGVHFRGIVRAAARNISDRKITQGASTLTMQLARNTFQLHAKSFHRKLLEVAIAFRIEANYSKGEILAAYLNRIYFGAGAYGIEQAAHSYFGKTTSQLTIPEGALLVGIIRAPHDYSPRNDLAAATRERNQVLLNMALDRVISGDTAKRLQKAPVHLMPPRENKTDAIRCVRRHLNELLDRNNFRDGGLTAESTIDLALQSLARKEIDKVLAPFPDLQAALVAIDPSTGAIRSVITAREPESSQFNRAFDIRRQLGPAFQPFLYAFATERGHLPIPGQPLQTARQLPSSEIIRLAKRIGFTGPFTKGDELARGNLQTSPLEVAAALTCLANKGKKPNTYLIERLLDAQDKPLFAQKENSKLVLDPFSVEAVLDILENDTWACLNNPETDLWTLHFSPELSLALWVGYDTPQKLTKTETETLKEQLILLTQELVALTRQENLGQENLE